MVLMLITDCLRACPDARTENDRIRQATAWLVEAIEAGVDRIQVREPTFSGGGLYTLTSALVGAAQGTGTTVLVNNRADVARAAGAGGVHLRDDGWPVSRIRRWAPSRWIVGRSIHDDGHGSAVADLDYVLFGAVYASGTKPARGVEALARTVAASGVPVLAVGGVTEGNIAACRRAGAAGAAAITPFLPSGSGPGAMGPREAVARLRYSYETLP